MRAESTDAMLAAIKTAVTEAGYADLVTGSPTVAEGQMLPMVGIWYTAILLPHSADASQVKRLSDVKRLGGRIVDDNHSIGVRIHRWPHRE